MLAALLENVGVVKVKNISKPVLMPGSAILKVQACGICGSDLKFIFSKDRIKKYPAILGHEISGEIVETDNEKFSVGDRIATAAEIPCLKCPPCQKGFENLCDNVLSIGTTVSGGFCEYMLLTPDVLSRGPLNIIPEELGYNEAALSETLGCVINALEFARMSSDKNVLVVGAGYMGCLIINMARFLGAKLISVVDKSQKRLELAKDFQADHYICSETMDSFVDAALEVVDKTGYDVVITACSDTKAYNQAILTAAKGGFVNLFGGIRKGVSDIISFNNNFVHYREISIGGSFSSTRRHHQKALEILKSKNINTDKLITHIFHLKDFEKALDTVKRQEGLKVIINP